MSNSPWFQPEHQLFRSTVRAFLQQHVTPHIETWEQAGQIPRSVWQLMGQQGYFGLNYPAIYGGQEADFFYSVVLLEEIARTGSGGVGAAFGVHQYVSVAHIARAGSEYLRQRYLVPAIAGTYIGALAISEPFAGSNVAGLRTHAVRQGDYYCLNGSKTFITNGYYADFIVVACQADTGLSLLVVDADSPGLTRTKLQKIGWHCSDTAELGFHDVMVPVANLIGAEGNGFYYIMDSFQLERLIMAIMATAGAELCIEQTLAYMHQREAFGKPIAKYQALRHRIADLATELAAATQFTYHTCYLHAQGEFAVKQCSMAKLLTTELANKITDACLQMFGGYGYMEAYPIARMYRDVRVGTIAGGTSEIMREIIARMVIDDQQYQPAY